MLLLLGTAVVLFLFYWLKIFLVKRGKRLLILFSSHWQTFKQKFAKSPRVWKFTTKHPHLVSFLKHRLGKKEFSGVPLTLLMAALLYAIALLVGLVEDVITADAIVLVDTQIAEMATSLRSPLVTEFFIWVTLLGKWQVVVAFITATTLLLIIWHQKHHTLSLLVSVLGSQLLTHAGKLSFQRGRPDSALYLETTYSFPSGHASIAIALYGFLTYLLIRNTRHWRSKINIFLAGAIIALLIGLSRMYLGVHFLSDILGGYLAGVIWLIIAITISEFSLLKIKKLESDHATKSSYSPSKKGRVLTALVIFLALTFYILFSLLHQLPEQPSPPSATPLSALLFSRALQKPSLTMLPFLV